MAVSRCLPFVGICLLAASWNFAAEPAKPSLSLPAGDNADSQSPKILPSSSDAKSVATVSGRKKLEAQLQMSADLDFGGRPTVTLKEVLDQLHSRHKLSIRFDEPILTSVFTADSSSSPAATSGSENQNDEKPASTSSRGPTGHAVIRQASAEVPAPGVETATVAVSKRLNTVEIDLTNLDVKTVSVATLLRHSLDAVMQAAPNAMQDEDFAGFPILLTNATLLDYIVEDDGLLITSRMNSLLVKETRVYSIKNLKDYTPEQLAKVIRLSIRPWSWRSQINDLGEQLKASSGAVPPAVVTSLMKAGVQMASAETGISVDMGKESDDSSTTKNDANGAPSSDAVANSNTTIDAAEMAAMGHALVNGLVTVANASLSALEMAHYADLPTGTIQTLPGKLVITQSQAAHREIADLLKQLSEE